MKDKHGHVVISSSAGRMSHTMPSRAGYKTPSFPAPLVHWKEMRHRFQLNIPRNSSERGEYRTGFCNHFLRKHKLSKRDNFGDCGKVLSIFVQSAQRNCSGFER